ncbi:MAG: caspase family protein [Labrys sp. (in: a-proteobacteria)]
MTLRRFVMAALVVLAGAAQGGPADAAEHAALVIGNAAYQSVTPLANPVNDADDMANALRGLGYATTLVTDGSLDAMNEGLRQFLRDADGASAATIFYAGHGVQVNGKNFLIPVDAVVRDELDLDTKAVSLDKLLDLVDRSGVKVKIVILDACRDNPLARSLVRGAGTRGLARVELPASSAKGTLIAFSTAPGSVAQDGTGRNSPFTEALLKSIATPGLDIRAMFGQVRADVDAATQGAQTPWVNEAIVGSFSFAGGAATAQQSQTSGAVVTPQVPTPPVEEEIGLPSTNKPQQEAALNHSAAEFIFADSDRRYLTYEELSVLSSGKLRVARNEIFARKGRFMKDANLRAYFEQFSWYSPFTWEVTLNPIEKENVALIQSMEAQ